MPMALDILGGIMGGGGGADSTEFGSSTASTVFGSFERGRNGGLTPEYVPLAILAAAVLVILFLARK